MLSKKLGFGLDIKKYGFGSVSFILMVIIIIIFYG